MSVAKQYHLKIAEPNEEGIAMDFICQAKEFLKSKGVDQWQKGYPDASTIQKDIANHKGYFLMEEYHYLAYLCIDFEGEMAYDNLQGHWLSDVPYGVLHRLAVGNGHRGKGLASVCFQLAEDLMKSRNVKSFRIDTDENNEIMKHLLSKNGFTYCGTIWFDNSIKIAYEKLLK